MNIQVKDLPAYHVAYVRHVGAYGAPSAQQAFGQLMRWAVPRGHALAGKTLGICWDDPDVTPPEQCRYDACITVPEDTAAEGEVAVQTIRGGTYAVYHCEVRNNDFGSRWNELMGEWLPASGYQPDDGPCYEVYLNNAANDPEGKWLAELCCPVKPVRPTTES